MSSLYCLLAPWHSFLILLLHPKDKKSNNNPRVPSLDAVGTLTPHKPLLEQDAVPTTDPQHTPIANVLPFHYPGIYNVMRGLPGSHQTWRWRWWMVILSWFCVSVCVCVYDLWVHFPTMSCWESLSLPAVITTIVECLFSLVLIGVSSIPRCAR